MTAKILLIEDEAPLAEMLRYNLEAEGFRVSHAENGEEAEILVAEEKPDLLVLDWMLPGVSGIEICRRMRARMETKSIPIVMLTAQDSDSDEILGLESGANDYVTKPFRFSVLLARIRAALRQHDQSEDVVFTIGPYSFQPANKVLENDGSKIRFTDKETSILKYLYRQGPKTIGRDVLLKEVWGYNNRVTTHTLETHIYRLRQKIEKDPSHWAAVEHLNTGKTNEPRTFAKCLADWHANVPAKHKGFVKEVGERLGVKVGSSE